MAIESHIANDQDIQSRRASNEEFTRRVAFLEAKVGTRQRIAPGQPQYTVNNTSERVAVRPISAQNTIKVIENVQLVLPSDALAIRLFIKGVTKNLDQL